MHSIALIGISGFARTHLFLAMEQMAQGRARLVAATVINQREEAFLCSRLRSAGCAIHASTEEMWSEWKGKIDLCMIPTGIPYHAPMVIEALRAGAHVFVEKPLATTTDEVARIIAAEEETGKRVAVGFQDVYRSETQMIKRRLSAGEFGRLHSATVLGLWPRPPDYYARNGWVGRLRLDNGLNAFDSPVSNAFAHFINLALYWASPSPAETAAVDSLEASLWRAQPIESFDTVALHAGLNTGAELFAYFSHACAEVRDATVGLETEKALIKWTHLKRCDIIWRERAASRPDEHIKLLGPMETRLSMMDAVMGWLAGSGDFVCTAAMARAHAGLVERLHASTPIHDMSGEALAPAGAPGASTRVIRDIERVFQRAAEKRLMPGQACGRWLKTAVPEPVGA
ncbi:MAG: Gfo/Idh/MocA family oxidoreductase [Opitutaceae bacterium]|jgi:predicted dehydrogenase|nr:Gfo/Idh/MocA family oxidoreductase [Opitutaceae bacterium]